MGGADIAAARQTSFDRIVARRGRAGSAGGAPACPALSCPALPEPPSLPVPCVVPLDDAPAAAASFGRTRTRSPDARARRRPRGPQSRPRRHCLFIASPPHRRARPRRLKRLGSRLGKAHFSQHLLADRSWPLSRKTTLCVERVPSQRLYGAKAAGHAAPSSARTTGCMVSIAPAKSPRALQKQHTCRAPSTRPCTSWLTGFAASRSAVARSGRSRSASIGILRAWRSPPVLVDGRSDVRRLMRAARRGLAHGDRPALGRDVRVQRRRTGPIFNS
jgi:hypothetical protein